jgi:hypothetical protein
MSEIESAQIIPFPARAANRADSDQPVSSQAAAGEADTSEADSARVESKIAEPAPRILTPAEARLARALTDLSNALAGQRAAMMAWKAALTDLRTVTGRLGTSLRSYNDSLGRLDTRVKTLRTDAVKLEAWADDVMTRKE